MPRVTVSTLSHLVFRGDAVGIGPWCWGLQRLNALG